MSGGIWEGGGGRPWSVSVLCARVYVHALEGTLIDSPTSAKCHPIPYLWNEHPDSLQWMPVPCVGEGVFYSQPLDDLANLLIQDKKVTIRPFPMRTLVITYEWVPRLTHTDNMFLSSTDSTPSGSMLCSPRSRRRPPWPCLSTEESASRTPLSRAGRSRSQQKFRPPSAGPVFLRAASPPPRQPLRRPRRM